MMEPAKLWIESNLSRTATNGMQTGGGFAVANSAYLSTATTDPVRIRFDLVPRLNDMNTWTERLGHSGLRSFTDKEGHFWLEQNASKNSKWAKLARQGHNVAWEFDGPGVAYADEC